MASAFSSFALGLSRYETNTGAVSVAFEHANDNVDISLEEFFLPPLH